ncbi:UNVERIFIED_CONTAM: hypothetical protein Sindi_2952000 [Sesamum indicum]
MMHQIQLPPGRKDNIRLKILPLKIRPRKLPLLRGYSAPIASSSKKTNSANSQLTMVLSPWGPVTCLTSEANWVSASSATLPEDRQRILADGPYFVYGRLLLLKHMPDCFEFKEDDISLTPVWATLPSLPLECWHPNALGKIGSRVGSPIAMDSLTMKMERVSYARILETCQGSHLPAVATSAAPATAPAKPAEAMKLQTTECTMVQRRNKGKAIDAAAKPAVEGHQPILPPANKVDKERGFKQPLKQNGVAHLIKHNQLCLLGILETKLAASKIPTFLSRSFSRWCQSNNFDTIAGGRILVVWNPAVIDLQPEDNSLQVIHCRVTNKSSQFSFYISFTYGLFSIVNRRSMWEKLTELGQTISMPWIIMGDFNCVKSPEEKQLGVAPTWYELKDFVDCCVTLGLLDAPTTCCYYTWYSNNERNPSNGSRPVYIAAPTSTHRDAYQTTPRSLKSLKGALKAFKTQHYNHISTRAKEADLALQDAQNQLESKSGDVALWDFSGDLRRKAVFLAEAERHFFY